MGDIDSLITSLDNAHVRNARAVRDGKLRELIFVEGARLCAEAVEAGLIIETAFLTERFARDEAHALLLKDLRRTNATVRFINERVLDFISDTQTPQGIVLLARRPFARHDAFEKSLPQTPLLVILHRVGNPSNAGSILRTAEAAGASGAIITAGSTDIFSSKALRGAMGSSFRLPLWQHAEFSEALEWCRAQSIQTIATDARSSLLYTSIDLTKPSALIVGAEATGIFPAEAAAADVVVKIPMRMPVESLNVGAASAILLYEAARQRLYL